MSVASLFLRMDATLLLDACYFSFSSGGAMQKERTGEGKRRNNDCFVVIFWMYHKFGAQEILARDAGDTKDILSKDVGKIVSA